MLTTTSSRTSWLLWKGNTSYGHLYIVNRLRRRCLPVPEDVERPDEYALAGNLVKRKFSYRADEARKAARFLQYRGFSPSVIRDVLEDFTVH